MQFSPGSSSRDRHNNTGEVYPQYQWELIHEHSSAETASNLPGAGRTMGKLFSLLGAALERRIYWSADKLGFGPLALRRKLIPDEDFSPIWEFNRMSAKQQKTFIAKLMTYARSVRMSFCKPDALCLTLPDQSSGITVTQVQAIKLICDLLHHDLWLNIHDEFINAGLFVLLENLQHFIVAQNRYSARYDPDLDILLASSRKALIFVEENEVNNIAKPLLRLDPSDFWRGNVSYDPTLIQAFLNAMSVFHSNYKIKSLEAPSTYGDMLSTLGDHYGFDISLKFYLIFRYLKTKTSENFRPNCRLPMSLLPRSEIEQFICATAIIERRLLLPYGHSMWHKIFKTVGIEGCLRYCSVVQIRDSFEEDIVYLDALCFPEDLEYLSCQPMEMISNTEPFFNWSLLSESQFSAPAELDCAILYDYCTWFVRNLWTRYVITVWDVVS